MTVTLLQLIGLCLSCVSFGFSFACVLHYGGRRK